MKPVIKKAVILTASSMKKELNGIKHSGTCVTALDVANNRIVRFVTTPDGAPVEDGYCDYFKPLDVFDNIRIKDSCPLSCQQENVLPDLSEPDFLSKFRGTYKGGIEDLYTRYQSIKHDDPSFMLDVSPVLKDISPFQHSLELIRVESLKVFVLKPDGGNKATKCDFRYDGKLYQFYRVTDPDYRLKNVDVGDAYLAVSIPTEPFDEKGYRKFVAAIFKPAP